MRAAGVSRQSAMPLTLLLLPLVLLGAAHSFLGAHHLPTDRSDRRIFIAEPDDLAEKARTATSSAPPEVTAAEHLASSLPQVNTFGEKKGGSEYGPLSFQEKQ
jgi:hypothetical protein